MKFFQDLNERVPRMMRRWRTEARHAECRWSACRRRAIVRRASRFPSARSSLGSSAQLAFMRRPSFADDSLLQIPLWVNSIVWGKYHGTAGRRSGFSGAGGLRFRRDVLERQMYIESCIFGAGSRMAGPPLPHVGFGLKARGSHENLENETQFWALVGQRRFRASKLQHSKRAAAFLSSRGFAREFRERTQFLGLTRTEMKCAPGGSVR